MAWMKEKRELEKENKQLKEQLQAAQAGNGTVSVDVKALATELNSLMGSVDAGTFSAPAQDASKDALAALEKELAMVRKQLDEAKAEATT